MTCCNFGIAATTVGRTDWQPDPAVQQYPPNMSPVRFSHLLKSSYAQLTRLPWWALRLAFALHYAVFAKLRSGPGSLNSKPRLLSGGWAG